MFASALQRANSAHFEERSSGRIYHACRFSSCHLLFFVSCYCSLQIILLFLCSSHASPPPLCLYALYNIFISSSFLSDTVSNWATQINLTSLSEELSHARFRLWKQFLYIRSLRRELTLTERIFLYRIETNKFTLITYWISVWEFGIFHITIICISSCSL